MRITADLHLHSSFSMATSRDLTLAALAEAARWKGIDLLSTADFTHPAWFGELQQGLSEVEEGIYEAHGARFILGTELSCVWRQDGRGRRVHLLVFAPGLGAAEQIAANLGRLASLESDGRPMINSPAAEVAAAVWDADPRCMIIPAHIWTPWYGMFGSRSGFDSVEECFGDLAPRIKAIETGLSSDPAMNWRVSELDDRAIVSSSDAHSPGSLGRELTVLDADPGYAGLRTAIERQAIVETIEFFPENGKYHLDGHRKCGIRLRPDESMALGGRCPKCGRMLTLGVLHRVEQLADRPQAALRGANGLMTGPTGRPPFRSLVALRDLMAEALGRGAGSRTVADACRLLVGEFGSELAVLVTADGANVARLAGEAAADAITGARAGSVHVEAGYDGMYGTVRIIPKSQMLSPE